MKRNFALLIVIVLLLLCVNPVSAEEYSSERIPKELHLEYMEFYDNQDYYKNLARNQGYRLVISVGPEFEELEEARIRADNSEFDGLVPAQISRGVDVPTRKHNVAKKEYKISGRAVQSTLYTEKKYTE